MAATTGKQKVLLLIANSRWKDKRPWLILPHSALILTALLKDAFDFAILDANIENLTEEECRARLAGIDPAAVLVSGFGVEYHEQYHAALALAKSVSKDIITILGGVYATVVGEDAIRDENIDYVFIGHAEDRVRRFLDVVLAGDADKAKELPGVAYRGERGETVINPVRTFIADAKETVKPDYSLLDVDAYVSQSSKDYQFNANNRRSAPIITSYGCPYDCLFCASRTISGRRVKYRPVEDVADEVDHLIREHGVGNLVFLDDSLLLKRPRFEAILNTFIERKYDLTWKAASVAAWQLDGSLLELMKKSGCTQITISVESGSPRVLNELMRKPLKLEKVPPVVEKCKELGIDVGANFVIGIPGETWDEIRQTFRFAETADFDLAHFHIATPSPKSDLYTLVREKGLLPDDFSFFDSRFFGYGRGFITTDEFTPFELMILRAFEWDRINFSTPEKLRKVAEMMDLTVEELNTHRRQTRMKCGVHY